MWRIRTEEGRLVAVRTVGGRFEAYPVAGNTDGMEEGCMYDITRFCLLPRASVVEGGRTVPYMQMVVYDWRLMEE